MEHVSPVDQLSRAWRRQWPDRRPIGHELRGGDRWVRFHSLPESKRYAETDAERAEILRRHNLVIDELVALEATPSGDLVVITSSSSWSTDPGPAPRDAALVAATPSEADYWQSILLETDDDTSEAFWAHLYVASVRWRAGVLDDLLGLVADWETTDVVIAPPTFEWLYHPYDGGADITTTTTAQRDRLRDRHRGWLSEHPSGL